MNNKFTEINEAESSVNINIKDFLHYLQKHGAITFFFVLVTINIIWTQNFLHINTFWNIIIQVFPIMVMGMGMTLVISSGGIDISIGSIMAISGMILGKALGLGVFYAIVFALLTAMFLGLINGFLISYFRIQPIIVTLILYISGRGIAQLLNDGYTIVFYDNKIANLGIYRIDGVVPIQLVLMIIIIALIYFLTKKMSFGYYVQAIGENYYAARLSGVNTFLILILAYVLIGALSGIAAIMEVSRTSCTDPNNIGKLIALDVIAAVAIGGTPMSGGKAELIGTIFGALIMQIITVSANMNNIHFSYAMVLKAIIILAAVYSQRKITKR